MPQAKEFPVDVDREYSKTIDFLYSFDRFGILLGLENISLLLAAIGNPQDKFKSVHVAGSNGKGSTSSFINAIVTLARYGTALYTSPHLNDFRERIRIRGKFISKDEMIKATEKIRPFYDRERTTFFEYTTAIAFDRIAAAKPDLAVIEVGLGGRLDATNTINPLVSVITDISREHEDYLGTGVRAIATEKSGIIKAGVPVVTGASRRQAREVILATARTICAPVFEFGRDFKSVRTSIETFDYKSQDMSIPGLRLAMTGAHQMKNASLAIRVVEELMKQGYNISEAAIREAISTTQFPGRFELLRREPDIIIDGAHTPEGMRLLKSALVKLYPGQKPLFLLGILKDKNIETLVRTITPIARKVICVAPHSDRSLEPEALCNLIRGLGTPANHMDSIEAGFLALLEQAGKDDVIVAAGSLYMIGPVRRACGKNDE
ncbi:MAG: bifunctional folylpolyglutamate synthase/dihydrofolate synthase [Desulfomonilaceae bacterium]